MGNRKNMVARLALIRAFDPAECQLYVNVLMADEYADEDEAIHIALDRLPKKRVKAVHKEADKISRDALKRYKQTEKKRKRSKRPGITS